MSGYVKDAANIRRDAAGEDPMGAPEGALTDNGRAELHLKDGARRVIISAPSPDYMLFHVTGVLHKNYKVMDIEVSNTSLFTLYLLPLLAVEQVRINIVEGLTTTGHATTATQLTVNGLSLGDRDWHGDLKHMTYVMKCDSAHGKNAWSRPHPV